MNSKISTLTILILLCFTQVAFSQDYILFSKDHNKTHTYKNNNGVTNTQLEYRGKIVFTDDETDVKYISPGGFLRFSKRSFGTKRTISLEGESNGKIYREYREGSKKINFEPDGKRWMASVLSEIIRTTGIGASERVKKFYAKGGINVLLAEISLIQSNYVKSIYYDASFRLPNLKTGEMALLINDAGNQVSSSYELSQILIGNASLYSKHTKALLAAIEAASKIGSSYNQSKVYKHLLTKADLSDTEIGEIIKKMSKISSSYDKSKVLQAMITDDLSVQNVKLIIAEIGLINSSYEQSKVLKALFKSQSIEALDFNILLTAISKINSTYEQSSILRQLVTTKKLNLEQLNALAQASISINSSYEQSRFLKSLIAEQTLDEASINSILAVIDDISSSYEQSNVLQLIIAHPSFGKTNFLEAIKQATKVNLNYEQSKILSKIIMLKTMPTNYMLPMIEAIDNVSSSYEKSKLLQQLAPQLPDVKEVKDAFYQVAESLSDFEYGKIMRTMRQ